MKYNKKAMLGIGTLAVLLTTVGVASGVSAYQGDYTKKGPAYSTERHEAMTKTFENKDYNAWKELMADRGRVTEVINEDNFAKFVEARNLANEGKHDEADAIRKELGLRTRDGARMGSGHGKGSRQSGGQKGRGANKGMNNGGKYVDSDGDGACDNL